MEQLSLFNEKQYEIQEGIIISKSILSPLESTKSVNSKEFREQQLTFSKYVNAIQAYHNCTFFEARDLFFEHRDNQKPIFVNFDCIF
ncbi:hypothetical protein D7X33_40385 [Butyricicoccus sp. 1XD8-22]|nr:hypothetical protein D7X33_40385 [Butyricicoccus sp. 1XD8-22]